MYCNNCGNEINNKTTICSICGEKTPETTSHKTISQKCCVCGNELNDKREPLLIGEDGTQKDVCATCALHIDSLENNSDKTMFNKAVAYFDHYRNYMDIDVKNCILNMTKEKSNANNTSSSSVVVFKVLAWFVFWATIIAGIVMGIEAREMGFIIFLIYVLVASLSISWTMVFLDLADDIRQIKTQMILNKKD